MKIIKVRAAKRDGHEGRYRAHRFWPSEEWINVEVLDQEEDFESEPGSGKFDPQTSIEIERVNGTTGAKAKAWAPHPTRMGQRAYRELAADPLISIHEGGELTSELSHAALDAARRQASHLAGELVTAQADAATEKERADKAEETLRLALAEIATLKEKAAAAPPSAGEAPKDQKPAPRVK